MVDLEATLRSSLGGRYAIEAEIGRGAMAVVYRAADLKHDRPVAIKVLRAEIAGAISEERFQREIEVVAGLAHPHILPLHDSGSAGGLLYFVMPLVEGESLRARLDRTGRLAVAEAIRIASEIADALAFSHQHGVIHRDVKPANIMLTGDHALLTDFGIAQLAGGAETDLTGTGITVGTPAYMSPEQATGERPVDGRADIYSLGCVLFEMVTGSPPFEDVNARAVLTQHLVGDVPSLHERRPEVPPGLSALVARAMAKTPEKRFGAAGQMVAALREVADGPEAWARFIGQRLRERIRRLGRWRWVPVAATAAVLLITLGPRLWEGVFPPTPAYGVPDPRGSYVVVPSTRAGQTEAEEELVVKVADWLAFRLGGLERVRVVQELDQRGLWADLGLEGPTLARLQDGLRLAQTLRVGTLITVTLRIVADSAHVEARQYDAGDGQELGLVQSQAGRQDIAMLDALVGPFLLEILNYRGGETDPRNVLSLSRNPLAHQEFHAGWSALYDWRLEEAERRFRESIAQDSTFALPYQYLALTLYWQTTRRPELMLDVGAEIARLVEQARRLALDSGLPSGHVAPVEAFAAFWVGDYEAARSRYDAILARDSTNSEAWLMRGAVEFEDPWAERRLDGGVVPRSNLNLAKRAFEASVRLARDHQLSYGLLFQIDRRVLSAAVGRGCKAFLMPGGPLLPPWQVPEAGDQSAFCPLMADSLIWIPVDQFGPPTRETARTGATSLYRETLRSIQMWADYVPNQPRPREEWSSWLLWRRQALGCDADAGELEQITAQALVNKQIELELKVDTTMADRVRLANLLLASGQPEAAEEQLDRALRERDQATSHPPRELPAEAANLYLATGRPTRAIDIVVPSQSGLNYSAADPRDGSYVSSGEVEPAFSVLRVLGASELGGDRLGAAFEELERLWSAPEFSERDRAILRRAALRWLSPALLLAPDVPRAWFSGMEDNGIEPPMVWRGLMAVDENPEAAVGYLEQVTDSLAVSPMPKSTALYLAGMLAERLGHASSAEHFRRLGACPAAADRLDLRAGLTVLALLHRARALEALGRPEEALLAYQGFAAAWSDAEPALQHMVTEARAAANRLGADRS